LKYLGAVLLLVGIILLLGFGIYEFMSDFSIPIIVKVGIVALVLGILVIIGALIIEKIRDKRGNLR